MFEKIRDIIVKELGVDPSKVTLETNLYDDLGVDSLDAVELIMALEDEFNTTIDDEEAMKLQTVKAIVEFAESLK